MTDTDDLLARSDDFLVGPHSPDAKLLVAHLGDAWAEARAEIEGLLTQRDALLEAIEAGTTIQLGDAERIRDLRAEVERLQAEAEDVADFLASEPEQGWQSACLVWRDRAETAEAEVERLQAVADAVHELSPFNDVGNCHGCGNDVGGSEDHESYCVWLLVREARAVSPTPTEGP